MMPMFPLSIPGWQDAYRRGSTPRTLLTALLSSLDGHDLAWISLATAAQLERQLRDLDEVDAGALPLYGVPFAVKDNLDAEGWLTTAACPAFSHLAERDATVIARLRKAGAVLIGKTNLDQFATGLVGTRSPYGAVPNSFDARYVSGGSSSGSASVVARGLVPFALGSDTAGSGRVPAGFNNIVGLKPTKGWLSTYGLLPACRTLDCVSLFALSVADARLVADIAGGFDTADPYSRVNPQAAPVAIGREPRLAIPDQLEFFGDTQAQAVFEQVIARLQLQGAQLTPIDFSPFKALAEALYQGPWVAERSVATAQVAPQDMDPVVRGIVAGGHAYSACDLLRAEYQRAALAAQINQTLADFDALLVPTAPTIRTLAQIAEQPLAFNSQFGYYTNFTNLADLCALAVPAGLRDDGLPSGITFIAPAWHDQALADLAQRWQASLDLPLGATGQRLPLPQTAGQASGCVRLAVVGAHLSGMPLNHLLTERNAVLVEKTVTCAAYRLYALPDTQPAKPGLARVSAGCAIEVELWDVPLARFGELVAEVPPPLAIGNLQLADGRWVKGFVCEPLALEGARDISAFGGWRAFVAAQSTPSSANPQHA